MSASAESYVIEKNSYRPFGKTILLIESLRGWKIACATAIFCLACEAFLTFATPVIIQVTLDSVLGSAPPSVPFTLRPAAEFFFGKNLSGGGIFATPSSGAPAVAEPAYAVHPGPIAAAAAPADNAPSGAIPAAAVTAGAAQKGSAGGEWIWRTWIRTHLWSVALAFLACILLQSIFGFFSTWFANLAAEHSAKRMRDRLYAHVQDLPYETLLRSQSGDWLQRCTSDVDTARRFISNQLMDLARTVFMVGFSIPVMFSLSPRLTGWGCISLPVILLYALFFHKAVSAVFVGAEEREGVLSGVVQENVTGVRVVRAFARQEFELERFDRANDRFRDHIFKLILILSGFWGISTFLGLLQIGIVIGAGLLYLGGGTITLGTLFLFIAYEQDTVWPIRQFGRVLADLGKTRVALGRMAELLALPVEKELDATEVDETPPSGWARGDIEFDRVSFTYPDGTKVLDRISFVMKGGERLAVVGPTGSGKSTLVHLLLRFYEPTEGTIRIGGRDIRTIPKRILRREIALVLQEGFLYGKTIRENIRMGNKDAGEERLESAARKASLRQMLDDFSRGWNTMVGERGVTLSGGQRQRLSLARAFVRDSAVLVLDDSLSAVDTETDRRIREAISESGSLSSMIIIAHRLTTLASADRILVLENGRVTALGTHRELTETPGLYKRLASLQQAIAGERNEYV